MSASEAITYGVLFAIIVVYIASLWKIFDKADRPGWASIVPIYNTYVLIKVAGRPGWWLALFIIPVVNWIAPLIVYWDIAKRFGKGDGFALANVFFPIVTMPILAFSDAEYTPKENPEENEGE